MLQFVSHLYLGWSTWHLLMNFYQVAQITIVLISGCSVQGQHWPPGGVENRGQVRGVRPSPPGPGQGHHDLHAPDEVYVQVRLDVHMLMKPNLSTSPFLTIYQTLVSAIWWRVQNLRGRGRGWPEHKTPSIELRKEALEANLKWAGEKKSYQKLASANCLLRYPVANI